MKRVFATALLLSSFFTQAETVSEANSSEQTINRTQLIDNMTLFNEQRKHEKAYQLAHSFLAQYEGDPEFDFYYAISASRIGKFEEAQLIFHRLLVQYPDQLRYRLEYARCQYYLRNFKSSEKEFKQVLAANPPYEVQVNIRQFLQMIEFQKRTLTPHLLGGVNLVAGYDDNINSATDENALNFSLPIQTNEGVVTLNGTLPLSGKQRALESSFMQTQGYVSWLHPVSLRSGFDVLALGSYRANKTTQDFDMATMMTDAGYQILRGPHMFRAGAQYSRYWLDTEALQQQVAVSGQWQFFLDKEWALNTRMNLGSQESFTNNQLNMHLRQANVSLNHMLGAWKHSLAATVGKDKATQGKNAYQAKNTLGLSYRIQHNITDKWNWNSSLGWSNNAYQKAFPDTDLLNRGKQREEDQFILNVGTGYQINKQLVTKLELSHTNNRSNLTSYRYRRSAIQAGISWAFN